MHRLYRVHTEAHRHQQVACGTSISPWCTKAGARVVHHPVSSLLCPNPGQWWGCLAVSVQSPVSSHGRPWLLHLREVRSQSRTDQVFKRGGSSSLFGSCSSPMLHRTVSNPRPRKDMKLAVFDRRSQMGVKLLGRHAVNNDRVRRSPLSHAQAWCGEGWKSAGHCYYLGT